MRLKFISWPVGPNGDWLIILLNTVFIEYTHLTSNVKKAVLIISLRKEFIVMVIKYAEVAELADALGSGSSTRKGVRVRVPLSAPRISITYDFFQN